MVRLIEEPSESWLAHQPTSQPISEPIEFSLLPDEFDGLTKLLQRGIDVADACVEFATFSGMPLDAKLAYVKESNKIKETYQSALKRMIDTYDTRHSSGRRGGGGRHGNEGES